MATTHLQNLPTSTPEIQAQVLYHWLSFVNGFIVIDTNDSAVSGWPTPFYSSGVNDGAIDSGTPTTFYDSSGHLFDATYVNKYIAILDTTNPTNCSIHEITGWNSLLPAEVQLDANATLSVSAVTGVSYIVFDTAASLIGTDFFVVQTPVTSGPQWQAKFEINASPAVEITLGFVGGFDADTNAWVLSTISALHRLPPSMARTFCVVDSSVGYVYIWSEDLPGGTAGARNALWVGSMTPFHSPSEVGVPRDPSYSAIFGSTTYPAPADNLSRDTTVVDNFVIGEVLNDVDAVVPIYIAQKKLLSDATDILTVAAATTNPRSAQIDDYDAIAFMRTAYQGWRGRVPGVRILNDSVANRTQINSNNTYVLGNGIGSAWNGKAPKA